MLFGSVDGSELDEHWTLRSKDYSVRIGKRPQAWHGMAQLKRGAAWPSMAGPGQAWLGVAKQIPGSPWVAAGK